MIGHASISETASKNGKSGDQTKREVCTRSYYVYNGGWKLVLRPLPEVADKSARACEAACKNDKIGYSQESRNSLHTEAKKVGYDLSKITTPCNCDCSSFMTVCAIAGGVTGLEYTGNAPTTATMRDAFLKTGKYQALTEVKYLTSDKYLLRGDILVAPGHHTVMVLTSGEGIMKTSQRGIDMIKRFESVRLTAYKAVPSEKYYTIGYGHYGADVKPGMVITNAEAEAYLRIDLENCERAVDKLGKWTQNQFDALVSFTFNCGAKNLNKLCLGRTPLQIANAMPLYNKAGGQVLQGLVNRRNAEKALFLDGYTTPATGNPYAAPTRTLKIGSRGNDVRWLQYELNVRKYGLVVDGVFGQKTEDAVRNYQNRQSLVCDGIVGAKTRAELQAGN